MKRKKIKKIIDSEKIAAGEVCERPANVVKELIENSIDAGANEIRIVVKKAGKTLIQVIDDGMGIPSEEIILAFERHTSSKIRTIKDLDNLSTLGFRGEALASITAVSQVEIISRTESDEVGVQIFIDGGKCLDKKEISCPKGTNIKVKNLFFNIPARRKFLKSDATELGHITDLIQRYALAYPDIHFIYQHNELTILNCPSNDLKTTVFHIYGKSSAKYMELIKYSEDGMYFKLHGLLGHPQLSKKNRNYSSIFINHRYVISDLLFRAVKEAYKDILMIGKYPFFILHIEMDPSKIDFNIHPKKLYIRFENEDFIYNKVYNILRKFVEEKFIIKETKYLEPELDKYVIKPEENVKQPPRKVDDEAVTRSSKAENTLKKEEFIEKPVQLRLTDQDKIETSQNALLADTYIREKYIITENFPKLHLISHTGQLSNKVYVLLEGLNENDEPGLFILDQHAASERINKEFFLEMYEKSKGSKQRLISPLKIEVSATERFFLESNLSEINKLGFNFEHFGGNTFILREIPSIIQKLPKTELINEIISDITEIGKERSFAEVKEEIINYMACHKSIRGGDDLSLKDIRDLILDLSQCKDPFHCAHSRPTLRFISLKELDKLFKRRV
ncbi:MAG: DNA mismatch repair endonuclease MutL [Promethearchaeota archaeon]|nr:MAG: DNA mismatch repair endonuclease MutL [Candidatus Lokiarchaeota archaeon]